MYLSGYWEYRTYKANRLPSLTLDLTPAQYNRDITKRYDSGQDLDVYRTQQSYYAYGGLSVRQNLDLTGGTFYLESNLAYMRNFGVLFFAEKNNFVSSVVKFNNPFITLIFELFVITCYLFLLSFCK